MGVDTQRRIWSAVAHKRKDAWASTLIPAWSSLLTATAAGRGKQLLDAGCGSGELAGMALELSCEVTGIDISPTMVELCRTQSTLAPATFHECGLEDLPFEDTSFDIAIAAMSVHFCVDPERALRELFRVLRVGGRIAVSAPSSPGLGSLLVFHVAAALIDPALKDDLLRPLMFASDGVLAGRLAEAGFRDIEETVVSAPLAAGSFEELWAIQKTWAPIMGMLEQVDEARFLAAYRDRLDAEVGTCSPAELESQYRIVSAIRP